MKWRENIWMKALAFIAAVAAFTTTAIMGWYQLANFDALWGEGYSSDGYTMGYLVRNDSYMVRQLLEYDQMEAKGETLSAYQQRNREQLESALSVENTNLRWQLIGERGEVIRGNTQESGVGRGSEYWYSIPWGETFDAETVSAYWPEAVRDAVNVDVGEAVPVYLDEWREALSGIVDAVQDGEAAALTYNSGSGFTDVAMDTVFADGESSTEVLVVSTPQGQYVYGPSVENSLTTNQFGYRFDTSSMTWRQVAEVESGTANLVLWVNRSAMVDDQYMRAAMKLEQWQASREQNLAVTIVCTVSGILLTVYLCASTGHRRGVDGISLNWFHRIPGDVLLFLMFLMGVAALGLGFEFVGFAYGWWPMYQQLIVLGAAGAATAALGLGALMTVCARCKAPTLLRNTLTWRLCAWCWRKAGQCIRAVRSVAAAVPLIWKAVLGSMAYIIFTILTFANGAGLWLLVTAVAAVYLCLWAYQWKKIRYGTQEIIGGNPNYHIDTQQMLPDLRGHADELNNLGQAISAAVEDRIRSERFKAELITNVSHDLKTPLTSIINYVDLLKKVDIQDSKAAEYIEVLDRKSQRLKKLTEDLVEASKASTGNLTVNWERLDLGQLADQALAECGDRLEAQGLTVVRSLPEEPMWVDADGRHLWRVLDNLLSNCSKYALPGTRVYVDLRQGGCWAVLTVKNISRDALDIPAERLVERFVRGDESRNEAGSGLGLSISQSLTELQHGRFDISVDGDLFKAMVSLPLAGAEPEGMLDPAQYHE